MLFIHILKVSATINRYAVRRTINISNIRIKPKKEGKMKKKREQNKRPKSLDWNTNQANTIQKHKICKTTMKRKWKRRINYNGKKSLSNSRRTETNKMHTVYAYNVMRIKSTLHQSFSLDETILKRHCISFRCFLLWPILLFSILVTEAKGKSNTNARAREKRRTKRNDIKIIWFWLCGNLSDSPPKPSEPYNHKSAIQE